MGWADWIAATMTLVCVALVARHRKEGFLVGAASEPLWFWLMWRAGYYGLCALGVVFFAQYVWGYFKWRREE